MALLNPRPSSCRRRAWPPVGWRLALPLLALAAAAPLGCSLIGRLVGERPLTFSHRLHVIAEELDCVICHENAEAAEDPGMPAPDTCLLCHEELDQDKAAERRIETLFEGETFRAAHHARLEGDVIFSHLSHAAGAARCDECHRGIDESERVNRHIGVDMGACIDCHDSRGVAAGCATCHGQIDRAWAPPSHRHQWERAHGDASRQAIGQASAQCSLCHAERDCVDCHLAFPPDSHNNSFRRKTHGIHAALDRDSCAACHRTDSCQRCHGELRPASHRGQWGSTKNRHCLGCHLPLAGNGCQVCHQGTPSHLLAAPKPPWHTPSMNCRQCHGISAPLPHVDNGDDCNACHL